MNLFNKPVLSIELAEHPTDTLGHAQVGFFEVVSGIWLKEGFNAFFLKRRNNAFCSLRNAAKKAAGYFCFFCTEGKISAQRFLRKGIG